MPRLEKDGRFWEVAREGRRLRIRSGALASGEPVREQQRSSHWEQGARRLLTSLVEAKLHEGWALVERAGESSELVRSPELERALIEAPTPERWAVYGDWLAAQGDRRGELITIDLELEHARDEPTTKALQARREALLAELLPTWFGDLCTLGPTLLRWRFAFGFLHELELGGGPGQLDLDEHAAASHDLAPALARVLAHPSAVMLERLRLGQLDRQGRRDLRRALDILASEPRPCLRRLELAGTHEQPRKRRELHSVRPSGIRIGSLAPLTDLPRWAPRLDSLRIRGRELGELPDLSPLRSFELTVPELDAPLRRRLLAQAWPRLERLVIASEVVHDPWSGASLDLAQLLTRASASGQLRELGVHGPTALLELCEHPCLDRLEVLVLPRLRDVVAELLLARTDRLAGIRQFVLDRPELDHRLADLRDRLGSRLVAIADSDAHARGA